MRTRSFGTVLLAALLLAAGCASPSTAVGAAPSSTAVSPALSPLAEGLLADSDHRGLVASYIGGVCDGPARLRLTETASRIDVTVLVGPDPNGPEPCATVGIFRTVAARLAQPIGDRTIFSGARQQVPFTGSRRLVPSALPPRFVLSMERSGGEPAAAPSPSGTSSSQPPSSPDTVDVTTRRIATYTQPAPGLGPPSYGCSPTRGTVDITVAPATADDLSAGSSETTTVHIGGHSARLLRSGSARAPTGWSYVWKADQGTIEVRAQQGCAGDQVLSPTELLTVAKSLRAP